MGELDSVEEYGMTLLSNGDYESKQAEELLEAYGLKELFRTLEVQEVSGPELSTTEGVKTTLEEIELFALFLAAEKIERGDTDIDLTMDDLEDIYPVSV